MTGGAFSHVYRNELLHANKLGVRGVTRPSHTKLRCKVHLQLQRRFLQKSLDSRHLSWLLHFIVSQIVNLVHRLSAEKISDSQSAPAEQLSLIDGSNYDTSEAGDMAE